MSTTQSDIRGWLEQGKTVGATHVIVACDTFDWEDYPVFVLAGQDVRAIAKQHDGPNMTKLMEVYALHLDWDAQLAEHRSRHYEVASEGRDKDLL